jgi:2-aminoadipate transaminase
MPSVIERYGTSALQYGATEGDQDLREQLIRLMVAMEDEQFSRRTLDEILVTTGSQQALDLCARIFLSPGDVVLCGLPSYLGALGAFTACGARLSGVPLDNDGLRTDLLEQRLVDLRRRGVRPKLVYTVPDFQNPSGVTLSLERRSDLLSIAREFDLLVLEDSPYRELRYVGDPQPCLAALDRDGRVVSMFTFSKMLFPGLRLGWTIAHSEIISRLVTAKQPVDCCTSGLCQVVAREYLKTGWLPGQLDRLREMYAVKRRAMLAALDQHIEPSWGVRWTRPEGGLFLWMTLPEGMDGAELLRKALEEKMAFVTGRAFHCDGSGRNTLRLNFSYPSVEQLDVAAQRLARCIEAMMRELGPVAEEKPAAEGEMLVAGDHSLEQLAWNLALAEVVE